MFDDHSFNSVKIILCYLGGTVFIGRSTGDAERNDGWAFSKIKVYNHSN